MRVAPTEEERVRGEGKECVWETRQSTARCRREGMCVFENQREEERMRGECRQGMCVGEGRRARDVCVGKQGMCVLGRQGRKSAKGGRARETRILRM